MPCPSRPRGQTALAAAIASMSIAALSGILAACGTTPRIPQKLPRLPGFVVFDGAPTPDDVIPVEVATALMRSERPEFATADIRKARRVLANDPGWLVPATNGEICLERLIYPLIADIKGAALQPTPSQMCTSESEAQAGRLVETHALLTSGREAKYSTVVGVVPNGVATVTIVSRSGRRISVTVLRNAYEAVVADPVSVRYVMRHRGRLEEHAIPLTSFNSRSASPQP